jgi:hypothetical protein
MRRITLSVFFIFLLVLSASAQDPKIEQGKPAELKGLVNIYVNASDERARQNIVGQIKRQLPQLIITDKAEDAQVLLKFQETRRLYRRASGAPRGSIQRRGATEQIESKGPINLPTGEFEIIAIGEVIKPVGLTSARRLLRFNDALSSSLEDKLSNEFASAFIKIYKKANHK